MFLADHDDSDDENDPDLLMTLSSELGPVSYVTVARGPGSPSTNQKPLESLIDQSEAARGHSKVTTLSESRSQLTHIISHFTKEI